MKIIVRTQFTDMHCWENAPEEVSFLRHPHRHIFYVEAEAEVTHDDRELEFFMVKDKINEFIIDLKQMPVTKSCEQMGLKLKELLKSYYKREFTIRIFEDNENGVEV